MENIFEHSQTQKNKLSWAFLMPYDTFCWLVRKMNGEKAQMLTDTFQSSGAWT